MWFNQLYLPPQIRDNIPLYDKILEDKEDTIIGFQNILFVLYMWKL